MIVLFGSSRLVGQGAVFQSPAQYLNTMVLINPAYSGNDDALSVNFSYRDQWVGLVGAPKSVIFAVHTPVQAKNVGFGFQLQKHNYGIQQSIQLNGDYAYLLNLSNSELAFGLGFGIFQNETLWSDLIAYDPDDNSLAANDALGYFINFRLGAYYKKNSFSTGLSILNLFPNQMGSSSLGDNYHTTGIQLFYKAQYKINEEKQFNYLPSVLLRYNGDNGLQCDIAAQVFYQNMFGAGILYRSEGSLAGLFNFKLNDQARIGYSYGFNFKSQFALGSTQEILLKYIFRYKRQVESIR